MKRPNHAYAPYKQREAHRQQAASYAASSGKQSEAEAPRKAYVEADAATAALTHDDLFEASVR